MPHLKKVLIASYYFPPLNRIASSRPNHWGRYLEERGYDVKVYTTKKTELDGALNLEEPKPEQVIEHESNLLAVFFHLSRFIFFRKLWVLIARWHWALRVPFSRDWTDSDVVITSYGPKEAIAVGFLIKILCPSKKWIIDYRDLWTSNPYSKSNLVSKKIEKAMTSRADYLITVSEPLAEQLRFQFPDKKVGIIYNGFDREALPDIKSATNFTGNRKLRVVHAGTIYPKFRDPEPLFKAVANLISNGVIDKKDCELVFLGDKLGDLHDLARKHQLLDIMITPGQVSRSDSLQYQANANALILLNSNGVASRGIVTGKVFEYIISRIPILGIGFGSDSVASDILEKTGTGRALGNDVKEIYANLVEILAEGAPSWFQPNMVEIESFTRDRQAEKLIDIISHHL